MKVVIISGPTACGKTQTSLELARLFGGEIVNFDSLLLYREINIGTAKPTLEERQKVPHHMIDVRGIASPMNAAQYTAEAMPLVDGLLKKHKVVFLVGGSGFYLQALLKGMYDSPTSPADVTARSNELYAKEGIAPFREFLKLHDPLSFERHHENDHYRIRRAVEHFWSHNTAFSEQRLKKELSNVSLQESNAHGWEILHIHLDLPKEEHLKIVQKRTEQMLKEGLIEEVKALLLAGHTGKEKPLQCIGYLEVLEYLAGNFKDLEECRERIIISTRQLAKAQRTWFKKDMSKKIFHPIMQRQEIQATVKAFLHSSQEAKRPK